MFPALVIAFAGSLCFGFSAQAATPKSWIGLEFGIGMISFGLMQVPSIGFNYLIEAYVSTIFLDLSCSSISSDTVSRAEAVVTAF